MKKFYNRKMLLILNSPLLKRYLMWDFILEQTATFINKYLEPLLGSELTPSMITAIMLRKKMIARPEKKQYSREQIAYLFLSLFLRRS